MLWILLLIFFLIFFIGLLFFFRYVLTRNISSATGHLHDLSKEYVSKEEEASRLLQKAQNEAKAIVAREAQAAQEARDKMIKEAQVQREKMISEANQRSAEITEKAQRNANFIQAELDKKIDERARAMVNELVHKVIPHDFLKDVHQRWLSASEKVDFDLKHLKLADEMREAKIVSAFVLTNQQEEDLKKKLAKTMGGGPALTVEVDPSLMAGFVITVGSVVVDASLKNKIQKAMRGQLNHGFSQNQNGQPAAGE